MLPWLLYRLQVDFNFSMSNRDRRPPRSHSSSYFLLSKIVKIGFSPELSKMEMIRSRSKFLIEISLTAKNRVSNKSQTGSIYMIFWYLNTLTKRQSPMWIPARSAAPPDFSDDTKTGLSPWKVINFWPTESRPLYSNLIKVRPIIDLPWWRNRSPHCRPFEGVFFVDPRKTSSPFLDGLILVLIFSWVFSLGLPSPRFDASF